jgi:hypothetical protein
MKRQEEDRRVVPPVEIPERVKTVMVRRDGIKNIQDV